MAILRPKTGPACGRPAPQGARAARITVLDPKTGLSVTIEVRPR